METDVANRFIWFKGEIVNVNDAKITILQIVNNNLLKKFKVFLEFM